MNRSIVIYGAGGHGLVVAEAAVAAGWDVVGFVDSHKAKGTRVGSDWKVLGDDDVDPSIGQVIVGIGDNAVRLRLTDELTSQGWTPATVIHPTAMISPSASIESGTFVGPLAIVHPESVIGRAVIINSRAVVEHHNRIGSGAHIAPETVLCGNVWVGDRTMMGASSVAIPGMRIGGDCVVGAGSVVIRDIADGDRVAGNPAQPIVREGRRDKHQ